MPPGIVFACIRLSVRLGVGWVGGWGGGGWGGVGGVGGGWGGGDGGDGGGGGGQSTLTFKLKFKVKVCPSLSFFAP